MILLGKKQTVQVVPLPDEILNIPGRQSEARAELVFIAKNLPPLGFRSYYVQRSNSILGNTEEIELEGEPVTIGYGKVCLNTKGHIL